MGPRSMSGHVKYDTRKGLRAASVAVEVLGREEVCLFLPRICVALSESYPATKEWGLRPKFPSPSSDVTAGVVIGHKSVGT